MNTAFGDALSRLGDLRREIFDKQQIDPNTLVLVLEEIERCFSEIERELRESSTHSHEHQHAELMRF